MLTLVRTVAPATLPVTLAEAKADLRVDHADEDTRITAFIEAATEHFEIRLGRSFVTQTWRADYDAWPDDSYLKLPLMPVQSVTSIVYFDGDNVQQTFAGADYSLHALNGEATVVLGSASTWPSTLYARADAVKVTFVTGYGVAATVPAPIKSAIKLHVRMHYDNVDQGSYRQAIDNLVSTYWVPWV